MDRIRVDGAGPRPSISFSTGSAVLPAALARYQAQQEKAWRRSAASCCLRGFWDTLVLIAPNFAVTPYLHFLYRHAAIHFCPRRDDRALAGLLTSPRLRTRGLVPTNDPHLPEFWSLNMPTHTKQPARSGGPERARLGRCSESGDFMTLHQHSVPESKSAGYELTDVKVKDTALFLVVMGSVAGDDIRACLRHRQADQYGTCEAGRAAEQVEPAGGREAGQSGIGPADPAAAIAIRW